MNGPGENTGPRYRELVDPLTADKRNRVIPAFGVRRKIITLDVARVSEPLGLKGDVWYCDYNSTGVGLLQLNNSSEDPFPAIALTGLGNMPFDEIFITSAAQPGLVLNLWYGYGTEFLSPTSAIATIGSITNPVKTADTLGAAIKSLGFATAVGAADRYLLAEDGGFAYGAAFSSSSLLASLATEQVFAAASNVNGAIIWEAEIATYNGTAFAAVSLHARTVVPAAYIDGDLIHQATVQWSTGAAYTQIGTSRFKPVRIAAGKGLWFLNQSGTTETLARRKVLYTLL